MSEKPEITLLIDSGNTRVKWIRAVDGKLDESSFGKGGLSEFVSEAGSSDRANPDRILMSSVARDGRSQALVEACQDQWHVSVNRLESRRCQAGISNAYDEPGTLGVDRWMAILGAARTVGAPLVVMDLGTATTLDAVDQNGRHLGGLILPGPITMLESLASDAGLPVNRHDLEKFAETGMVDIADGGRSAEPGVGPGTSTVSCILEGIRAAQIGALNQFLRNVGPKMNTGPALIATGGGAKVILSGLNDNMVIDPWLVFRGMLISQE